MDPSNFPPRIDPAIRALIPPLGSRELEHLEAALRREGCRDALVVWAEEHLLLDGHHRFEICVRLGLPYAVREMSFSSRDAALRWVSENQLTRRNLTDDQRAAIAYRLQAQLTERALAERGRAAARARWEPSCVETNVISTHADPERVRAALAERAKVSERRLVNMDKIAKAHPEAVEEIANGLTSIAEMRRIVARETLEKELEDGKEAKAVQGVFDVVVMDPPWEIESIALYTDPENVGPAYRFMTIEQIQAIPPPVAEDAHVFLWTTQKFLPPALDLLKAWGLTYVLTMVWHKDGGFQPYGLPQFNCEFVLYAHKGNPKFLDTKAFPTCFFAKRTGHSEKPEWFYDLLRRVTGGRRLDMYNRRPIEGFETWGDEAGETPPEKEGA